MKNNIFLERYPTAEKQQVLFIHNTVFLLYRIYQVLVALKMIKCKNLVKKLGMTVCFKMLSHVYIPALHFCPKIQLYSTIYIYIFILEPNKARRRGNIWLYGSSVLSLWGEGGKPTSKSAFYPLPFSTCYSVVQQFLATNVL